VTGRRSNKTTLRISELIHQRLNSFSNAEVVPVSDSHLDEDTIAAFVEARLGAHVSQTLVSHLVACKSCRRESAQLIRLESQIQNVAEANLSEEPNRLSAFLESLRPSMPVVGEDVVFAYQNPSPETEEDADERQKHPGVQSDQNKSKTN